MYRIEICVCGLYRLLHLCASVCAFATSADNINKQTHLERGNSRRWKKCGMHIKKTLVLQCVSPHQTKVNQTKHPTREEMHSTEGAQKSYCSGEREEKEKREEKKRSKERRGIPSLALHHRRSACRLYWAPVWVWNNMSNRNIISSTGSCYVWLWPEWC